VDVGFGLLTSRSAPGARPWTPAAKPFACDCATVNRHQNYVGWERHFGDNVMVIRKGAAA
jgi:hypothetical protein